jgi:hypothetical protein
LPRLKSKLVTSLSTTKIYSYLFPQHRSERRGKKNHGLYGLWDEPTLAEYTDFMK